MTVAERLESSARNVALGRSATQSSTSKWSADARPDVDAAVAVNGDLASPAFFHTSREKNPWWQVDLSSEFLLERVVIHNRLDCPERFAKFTLLRSTDGMTWFPVNAKSDDEIAPTYEIAIRPGALARWVRVRLDGEACLHLREIEVFGAEPSAADRQRLVEIDEDARRAREAPPAGRSGRMSDFEDFKIFIDQVNYQPKIQRALSHASYEWRERELTRALVRPGDKVLEVGTAVGVVSMTVAAIVGPENVRTFDANPDILEDAKANFARNGLGAIQARLGVLTARADFTPGSTADFYIANAFWASRLDATPDTPGIIKTVQVPRVCLEDEIASLGATVLICDIEGGEVYLLPEADLTGVRLIILETHYWAVGEDRTDQMVRKLIMQGFSLHLGMISGPVIVLRR